MNTNKLTAVFLTLLMLVSVGYAQFMSSSNPVGSGRYVTGSSAVDHGDTALNQVQVD